MTGPFVPNSNMMGKVGFRALENCESMSNNLTTFSYPVECALSTPPFIVNSMQNRIAPDSSTPFLLGFPPDERKEFQSLRKNVEARRKGIAQVPCCMVNSPCDLHNPSSTASCHHPLHRLPTARWRIFESTLVP